MSKKTEITRTKILGKGTPLWKSLLFERRIPHRYHASVKGKINLFRTRKVLQTPPIFLDNNSNTEIHVLMGKNYVYMGILALKSFLRFYNKVKVVIHGDGSLTKRCKKKLKKHIRGIRIIDLKTANKIMENRGIISHIRRNAYQLFRFPVCVLKLLDPSFVAKEDKIILLDTDILFLKPPLEIIEWIQDKSKVNLYSQSSGPNNRFDKKVLKKEFKNIKYIERINGGFLCYHKQIMQENKLRRILKKIFNNPKLKQRILSDQQIYQIIFGLNKNKPLPFNRYPVLEYVNEKLFRGCKDAPYKHYIVDFEGGIYQRDINKVINELKT